MTILVTGGAGFIGANFVIDWLKQSSEPVVNLDLLTYAGNMENLISLVNDERHIFIQGDIGNTALVTKILHEHRPTAILNFAAESHVDRSILGPEEFIQTNVIGTFRLLESARKYWSQLPIEEKKGFRFLHVSTDEVYGTLDKEEPPFSELHQYQPNSPYSASKASSDHLVRSYFHTYGLPTLTTNCSNNYGPYQFPEKLIPLVIHNAIEAKPIPVYGDGMQIRDWLYVGDHCRAIRTVLRNGIPGEVYNIGGLNEKTNLEIVLTICDQLATAIPNHPQSLPQGTSNGFRRLISHVTDRPGHDRRYAIDSSKIETQLGWKPLETFDTGLAKTVQWYLENQTWVKHITSGSYREWIGQQYGSI
jgi:dTDP-glucose 4,6-dehydratase